MCPHCGRPMSPQREQLYTALVNIRNTELTVYMHRYNIQSVLNTGFIGIAVTAHVRPESTWPAVFLPLALSLAGIVLGLIWLGFEVQGKKMFVAGWDQWIAEYERNWLRTHYNNEADTYQGPLLFQGLIDGKYRSPIYPTKRNPNRVTQFVVRVRSQRLKKCLERLQDWFAWENLNFLHRVLPILFIAAWAGYFSYTVYFWYANWVPSPLEALPADY